MNGSLRDALQGAIADVGKQIVEKDLEIALIERETPLILEQFSDHEKQYIARLVTHGYLRGAREGYQRVYGVLPEPPVARPAFWGMGGG